jgi:cytochrome c oxidase assembly protein subunit 15
MPLPSSPTNPARVAGLEAAEPSVWPHRAALLVAGATFLLVIAGGLVTSTGSGLAVPDWPLSFGQVFPRMEGGVLFEHGHRMIAATVGLLTIGLVIVLRRFERRAWVRGLGWGALAAVIVQGVLGGLTVLLRLPDATSIAHAGMAQVFFALTVTLAVVTAPRWHRATPRPAGPDAATTRTLTLVTVVALYAQMLLGAVVRHTGAGLAIPDFPLAFGRLVPPFGSVLVLYHFAHRIGAVMVTALVLWTAARLLRRHRGTPWLGQPAVYLVLLLAWQIFLGAMTIWTRRAVVPTTAHVAVGALLFVLALVLALRTHRLLEPAPAPALAPQTAR